MVLVAAEAGCAWISLKPPVDRIERIEAITGDCITSLIGYSVAFWYRVLSDPLKSTPVPMLRLVAVTPGMTIAPCTVLLPGLAICRSTAL